LTLSKDVAIIGGGIAGLTCALELGRLGLSVIIAERSHALGGHTAMYCCKATDGCKACGACRLEALLDEVSSQQDADVLLGAALDSAERVGCAFHLTILQNPQSLSGSETPVTTHEAQVSAVVLACGFKPFDPTEKPRFGYGTVPGVITGLDLDLVLRDGPSEDRALPQPLNKIAFIQCVGSRDPKIGRNYCSRVCCGYAFRLARLLKSRAPWMEATIFYMDAQSYDRFFDRELRSAQSELRLIRAIPGDVRLGGDGRPELVYQGPDDRRVEEAFDLVVLSVGIGPDPSHAALAALLGVGRNEDGFIGGSRESVETESAGVFTAGAVQGPKSIAETIAHATAAAARVEAHLRNLGRIGAS
jgi:heterodisulfide reductase subunit A2